MILGKLGLERFTKALDENEPYDLICLDLMMPELNGLDVLQMIRELEVEQNISKEKRCKIVMTTAVTDRKMIDEAYKRNCDAYLIKPLKRCELLSTVSELGLIEE